MKFWERFIVPDIRSCISCIAGVEVGDENVTVSVALKRTGVAGGASAPINGTLKFYGASTLESFKKGNSASAPIETTSLSDGDFSQSETAAATFPKGENKFFKAKIEE